MNLALTPFHAIASEPDTCTGCMLDHEHVSHCVIAFGLATMRGMPLCEMPGGHRFIYVAGQQGEAATVAPAAASNQKNTIGELS